MKLEFHSLKGVFNIFSYPSSKDFKIFKKLAILNRVEFSDASRVSFKWRGMIGSASFLNNKLQ